MSNDSAYHYRALGFRRLLHREDLLGEPGDCGFGSLIFDSDGRLWRDADGRTRLYTTRQDATGCWHSDVRHLDPESLQSGPVSAVLSPAPDEARAVIHHVIRIDPGLFLAFYSNGRGVRAAVADSPEGPFARDPDFRLDPEADWELAGQPALKVCLEANGGSVKLTEDAAQVTFWEIYDSYHPGAFRGELGWARVCFDKRRRAVSLLGRHERSPLPLLPPGHLCARCGGNLASDLRINGKRALFYYTRPNSHRISLYVALGEDPLFFGIEGFGHFDDALGGETVIEKFQAYALNGTLTLLYESRLDSGMWRTGLRRYTRVGPAVQAADD